MAQATEADGRATGAGENGARPLLELRGVRKRFGAVEALRGVDIEVCAGEVVALVGDNGAGKSTLVKSIAGVHTVDDGEIFFEGEPVRIHSPTDAQGLGIETVYQDLALCDNLDVVANMFLGREEVHPLGRGVVRPLSEVEMEKRALEVMKTLQVTTIGSVRTRVAALSGGQRQSIAISKAVMWRAKVVMLDEPTAALGVAQTRQVLDLIKRLREQGLGVIVISHNMTDVFEVADRILVLRLGQRVGTFGPETDHDKVIAAITGAQTAG